MGYKDGGTDNGGSSLFLHSQPLNNVSLFQQQVRNTTTSDDKNRTSEGDNFSVGNDDPDELERCGSNREAGETNITFPMVSSAESAEVLTRLFHVTIKWAKAMPPFLALSTNDQANFYVLYGKLILKLSFLPRENFQKVEKPGSFLYVLCGG